jgi:hypothetical protein
MKDYLSAAILSLRPGSEFSYIDNDYSTIEWHVLEGKAPTKAQIDVEIEKIKAAEATKAEDDAAAKAALLTRLGITADEAKLLLA